MRVFTLMMVVLVVLDRINLERDIEEVVVIDKGQGGEQRRLPSRSFNSHSTSPPSPLFNNDIKNHVKTLGIAITSCFKEVKFAYRNLILIFHQDKYNKKILH